MPQVDADFPDYGDGEGEDLWCFVWDGVGMKDGGNGPMMSVIMSNTVVVVVRPTYLVAALGPEHFA